MPHEIAGFLPMTTNNAAEYRGLQYACEYLLPILRWSKGPHTVDFFLDSKLVVEQINYRWAVRDPELAKFFRAARDAYSALEAFATVTVQHVRREFNKEADALCNREMDLRGIVCERRPK
jgi:ribonuclease HI